MARARFRSQGKTPRALVRKIVKELVKGDKSQRQIAAENGLKQWRVCRIGKSNEDYIKEKQNELMIRALEDMDESDEEMRAAMKEVVLSKDKMSPQAYRVLLEGAGRIGKPSNIHVGDVHNQVTVDARSVHVGEMTPEQLRAEREELESELGF